MAKGSAGTFQRGCPENSFPGDDLNSSATYSRGAVNAPWSAQPAAPQASQNLLAEPYKYNNRKRDRQLWLEIGGNKAAGLGFNEAGARALAEKYRSP